MSEPHTDRKKQREDAQRELGAHLAAARGLADGLGLSTCAYLVDMAIKECEQTLALTSR